LNRDGGGVAAAPRSSQLPAIALACTPFTALLLFVPKGGWLLIALAPLTLWPAFTAAIRADRDGEAFRKAVVWAILLSVGLILFIREFPAVAAQNVLRGESYSAEMFSWIETGIGKEADWHRFLPEHATHFAIFALLSLLSAGYLGLAMGAGLMGYMNYFVASAMSASSEPWNTVTIAWFPWSVCRVLAFIAFGVLLARPLLRGSPWPYESRHGRWFLIAASGLVLDVLLKILLAPSFRERLHELVTTAAR
jgi:hypothetical protein